MIQASVKWYYRIYELDGMVFPEDEIHHTEVPENITIKSPRVNYARNETTRAFTTTKVLSCYVDKQIPNLSTGDILEYECHRYEITSLREERNAFAYNQRIYLIEARG